MYSIFDGSVFIFVEPIFDFLSLSLSLSLYSCAHKYIQMMAFSLFSPPFVSSPSLKYNNMIGCLVFFLPIARILKKKDFRFTFFGSFENLICCSNDSIYVIEYFLNTIEDVRYTNTLDKCLCVSVCVLHMKDASPGAI